MRNKSKADKMVDVAEPTDELIALCAFGTEKDLHYLRRLGRSCARCADLYWARDGLVRHRALQREYARVGSLSDDIDDATTDEKHPKESKPRGMLAFIDLMDEARESGEMPFESLVLFARRTMQDDRLAMLYLLVYGIVTDAASTIVDRVFQMGEDWQDGKIAEPIKKIIIDQPPQAAKNMIDESMDYDEKRAIEEALNSLVIDATPEEEDSNRLSGEYEVVEVELPPLSDSGSHKASDEEVSAPLANIQTSGHSTNSSKLSASKSANDDDDDNDDASKYTYEYEEYDSNSDISSTSDADDEHYLSNLFCWWKDLHRSNPRQLRAYFGYIYPGRTQFTFEDPEVVEVLTLADRLFVLAVAWKAANVSQLLMNIPVMRINVRTSVFLSGCARLNKVVAEAASLLADAGDLGKLFVAEGKERIIKAAKLTNETIMNNFRRLGADSAMIEAASMYCQEAQRKEVSVRQMALIRPYLKLGTMNVDDDDDDNDKNKTAEPAEDINVSAAAPDMINWQSIFYFACAENDLALARKTFTEQVVDIAKDDYYAISIASKRGSVAVLQYLLDMKAANAAATHNYALCWAVDSDAKESVKLLMSHKTAKEQIDVTASDNYPICRATERGSTDIALALLGAKGVDPLARNGAPLFNAIRTQNAAIVAAIIGHKKFQPELVIKRALVLASEAKTKAEEAQDVDAILRATVILDLLLVQNALLDVISSVKK